MGPSARRASNFFSSEAEVVREGKPVGHHEPQVMAGKEVPLTRISETGDDLHSSLRVGKRRMTQG